MNSQLYIPDSLNGYTGSSTEKSAQNIISHSLHLMMRLYYLCCLLCCFITAVGQQKNAITMDTVFLEQIMKTKPEHFEKIIANKDDLIVQIRYTQINRDHTNRAHFLDYAFNLNKEQYFYPASTVKMPLAFLALEKLNELNIKGVDKFTTMVTDSLDAAKYLNTELSDNSAERPCIALFIRKIFLLSDNDAYNRLYEFLGQEYIQKKLTEKGYPDAVIRHWLSVSRTEAQNRTTHPVYFLDGYGKVLYEQPSLYSKAIFPSFQCRLGKGYMLDGVLIEEPFGFDLKNRIYLDDLHRILQTVIFPESFPAANRFILKKADYDFLYEAMSCFPPESNFPVYAKEAVWDASVKFLLYGAAKGERPKQIRIFNKIGGAYGFLTDIAYIVDFDKKIEFMLSATILCNSDGIFNDDQYDYENIGYPFLKELGQLIYDHEITRKQKTVPDLQKFRFSYK